jgi:uncharacterized protein (DUF1697 family)
MPKSRHVSLLRGINVGGSHIIRMTDLRAAFEAMGFTDVETLIQSGNVVFTTGRMGKAKIIATIEEGLSRTFSYDARVVVLTAREVNLVVEQAPEGFGTDPDRFRYDVAFVREPLTAREALPYIPQNHAVDAAHAGEIALYFRRLASRASQSHLNKLAQMPMYQSLTFRNWNTTTKLMSRVSR